MAYKVCLDPGHSKDIAGKCSPDKSYYEHEFALDMAYRMKAILERHGVEVTLTRKDGGNVTLQQRVKLANAIPDLDLFVSLHSNAAGNNGWYSAKGYVAYTSQAGEAAKRNIAARHMIKRAKEAGIPLRNGGLAHSLLYVLRYTDAPAVLIEHGFHTNQEETALLKTAAYRDKLAVANCKGILDYLGVPWKEVGDEPPVTDYRAAVQARFGLAEETVDYLEAYQWGDELLRKLATKG